MKRNKQLIGWLVFVSLTVLILVCSGCGGGGSSDTTLLPATTQPPAKPSGIVVSGGNTQATVSWTAVSDATSYNIYYATTALVTASTGTKIANAANPSVVTGLTNGTQYYFVVTAVNAGGESSVSSEKAVTPAAAPQAPGNPTGVTATGGVGQANVSWSAVTLATSYNVYYLLSATAATTTTVLNTGTKVSSPSSPLALTPLVPGTYYFSVTAVKDGLESGGQNSPKSAEVK
jgi:hypothetical protein